MRNYELNKKSFQFIILNFSFLIPLKELNITSSVAEIIMIMQAFPKGPNKENYGLWDRSVK